MKITVEIELGYPDLSMQKHVDFLAYVFKGKDVKTVKILDHGGRKISVIPSMDEIRKNVKKKLDLPVGGLQEGDFGEEV